MPSLCKKIVHAKTMFEGFGKFVDDIIDMFADGEANRMGGRDGLICMGKW